jgi:hypothetical protein
LKKLMVNLPEEFLKWVLQILQTSTVTEFNSAFDLQRTIDVVDPMILGRLKPKYPKIDDMLRSAEDLYMELATTNAWTGLRTKSNQSGFVAKQDGGPKRFCWNCRQDGHMLKACKKEKNQAAIDSRKKAFNELKAKAKKEKKDSKKEKRK